MTQTTDEASRRRTFVLGGGIRCLDERSAEIGERIGEWPPGEGRRKEARGRPRDPASAKRALRWAVLHLLGDHSLGELAAEAGVSTPYVWKEVGWVVAHLPSAEAAGKVFLPYVTALQEAAERRERMMAG